MFQAHYGEVNIHRAHPETQNDFIRGKNTKVLTQVRNGKIT